MKGTGKIGKAIEFISSFSEKHQKEIKLGLTITGVILTGITAANAGIKANEILKDQKRKVEEIEEDSDLNEEQVIEAKKEITIETVKKMAPVVIPPVAIGAATIWSAVSGYKSATKQLAAISAAYNLTEKKLIDYQDKAKELLGDKKSQAITDEVNTQKVKNTPPEKASTILNTGKGTTLCLDDCSGRYFYSSAEEIRKAFNTINKRLMDEYYISLNELYDELGLPDITLGEDLGFNVDDGLIDIDHLFTATLHNDDTPILVLNYDVSPKYMEHRGGMFR